MKFIDVVQVSIKAGNGGNGHVSFRKEKFVPKGGPSGGDGGKGADIVFIADENINTLLDFKYNLKYEAENGEHGGKSLKSGKSGIDTIIKVPCGTLIKDIETDEVICDLSENGKKFIAAYGGRGGHGNAYFKTATNQAPRYAKDGKLGEERNLQLELKLLADVGLVGYPNAGKSTLISVISAAKPKIADYPFTTLVPNLGIVRVADYQSFTVADIPGLIEGAAEGKGLGIQFLRHVERTKVLVFLIDANSENPLLEYDILLGELLKFNDEMKYKPQIITISKTDSIDEEKINELSKLKFPGDRSPLLISSVNHSNLDVLVRNIWACVQK